MKLEGLLSWKRLIVIHPVTGTSSGALRGKLDSGADVTVIPERLVERLNLTPKGNIWTRGYDGSYSRRPVYYVRLIVEGFDLPAVRCIVANRTNVLLGRNMFASLSGLLRKPLEPFYHHVGRKESDF